MAIVVFARSESLFNMDCNRMFKEIASQFGRGGTNFVTGVIRKENVGEFIKSIVRMVATNGYWALTTFYLLLIRGVILNDSLAS
jgi:hypothetical protein